MAPEGPVPLGRSRVPVYRSGALSSMEADHSCHIGFGDKNGRFGEMRKRRMSSAISGTSPAYRSDVLRQVVCARDIGSMRFSLERTAVMIVQRWRRSLKTSVIKL